MAAAITAPGFFAGELESLEALVFDLEEAVVSFALPSPSAPFFAFGA